MKLLADTNLTLFFTKNISLKTWDEIGSLNREIEIYKRLLEFMKSINFITYGGRSDRKYKEIDQPISIYPLSQQRFLLLNKIELIFRYFNILRKTNLIKTNQVLGADLAVWASRIFKKKLVIRCGYLYSRVAKLSGNRAGIFEQAFNLEKHVFSKADAVIVTTEFNKEYITNNYRIDFQKIFVVPNYVDIKMFKPNFKKQKLFDLVFIGRAGPEKNVNLLLEALRLLKEKYRPVKLLLIGGVCNLKDVARAIDEKELELELVGNIPNNELPEYLNGAKAYIIPSQYEGHPKTLLEAMGCGLPCIGTDVEGIQGLIEHLETGYLCQANVQSIAEAIENVLSNEELQKKLGQNARNFIVNNFALENVLKLELDVLRKVIHQ